MNWKSSTDICMLQCITESQGEVPLKPGELSSVPCVDSDRWDVGDGVGGRPKRVGIYVHIELIHFVVELKLIQHCKAIIIQ